VRKIKQMFKLNKCLVFVDEKKLHLDVNSSIKGGCNRLFLCCNLLVFSSVKAPFWALLCAFLCLRSENSTKHEKLFLYRY